MKTPEPPSAEPKVGIDAVLDAEEEGAPARGQRILDLLIEEGQRRGFESITEWPVPGGRLDLVWLTRSLTRFPGVTRPVPLAAFEIESSWRTRKHLKGDYLNLIDAQAAVGVLILLGSGDKIDATRRFAAGLAKRTGPRVIVWSEDDVTSLATAR